MNEYGQAEHEIAIANEFDASDRFIGPDGYFARQALSGRLIGPYKTADERDDALRDTIVDYLYDYRTPIEYDLKIELDSLIQLGYN